MIQSSVGIFAFSVAFRRDLSAPVVEGSRRSLKDGLSVPGQDTSRKEEKR